MCCAQAGCISILGISLLKLRLLVAGLLGVAHENVKTHDNLQDGAANQCTYNVSIQATFRFLL